MDRFFDNYVMTAMQKPVSEALRADATRKEEAMAEARQALDTAYAWLEERLSGRIWAAGESFTMADCAAAPSLFYADWVHQIGDRFPRLRDYRAQLLAHPVDLPRRGADLGRQGRGVQVPGGGADPAQQPDPLREGAADQHR